MTLRCVLIGYGRMGQLHAKKWRALGVDVVGVVDPRAGERAAADGLPVVGSVAEAFGAAPDLWDVCVPTAAHATVLGTVCALDRDADLIVEKPLCAPADVSRVRGVLAGHRGRVVVGENYHSSHVATAVARAAARLGLTVRQVVVEMSKHRGADVRAGRFEDESLGALGYEGPHLLAVLADFGAAAGTGVWPAGEAEVAFHGEQDAEDGPPRYGVDIRYTTAQGLDVALATSVAGRISHPLGPHAPRRRPLPVEDRTTRHRVLGVLGTDPRGDAWELVGTFEPVAALPRGTATVAVRRAAADAVTGTAAGAWRPVRTLADDSLARHLARTVAHFTGGGDNPAPPDRALEHLALLHGWSRPRSSLLLQGTTP
ncbi:Gfo/Idh/MocA family oxidoreductase [Streptomyces sp. NPDC004126]|uniref:Gfo/Idh/MocA family oxidoreductase n=1 Tax=Streptomyces sp. NPDC004126 TaxID=3390695 RepID=UPI003CFD564D